MDAQKQRSLIAAWIVACFGFSPAVWAESVRLAPPRPNIILIVADDVSWEKLDDRGSDYYETPNIDRLSSEGMSFTNGYVCYPGCFISRSCLMSGQLHPRYIPERHRNKVRRASLAGAGDPRGLWQQIGWRWNEFSLDVPTIAETLRGASYVTGHFGKWHLPPHEPSAHGFDVALAISGRWDHYDFKVLPEVEIPKGKYFDDLMTDHAIDFMKSSVTAHKKFFLYFPSLLIHTPLQAKPELLARFEAKKEPTKSEKPPKAAMLLSLDESVGRIVATVENLGISEETIIIFTSDNGSRHNSLLRGGKGSLYEGGVRVPFVFRWKGMIVPGVVSDEPIINVDLYPTLTELAGAPRPANHPLDGISITPILKKQEARLNRNALFWHTRALRGLSEIPRDSIRVGDFKLIEHFEPEATRIELFNLRSDLGESEDLSRSDPAKLRELQLELAAWRESNLQEPWLIEAVADSTDDERPLGQRPVGKN